MLARLAAPLAVTLLLAGSLAACAHENDPGRAHDSSTGSAPSASGDPSGGDPGAGRGYPAFGEPDYTYRLEVLCFCPLLDPVEVTVKDGVPTTSGPGRPPLTIDDIIDEANDLSISRVEVVWPKGQRWPTSVRLDKIPRVADDEITYVIKNVKITS